MTSGATAAKTGASGRPADDERRPATARATAKAPGPEAAGGIDRRAGLSWRDFDREYAARGRPVILADATRDWTATRAWSFEHFESRHGDRTVTFEGGEWTIAALIRRLRLGPGADGRSPYLSMVKIDEQFAELRPELGTLAQARHNRLRSRLLPRNMRLLRGADALFIGSAGSGFRLLHWDSTKLHVFISQIVGDKEFLVFHPDDTPWLYAKDHIHDSNHSRLPDPFDVDLDAFPLFRHATPIRFRLREGETLFLPAGWWHATRIDEPNIAIAESALDAHNWAERNRWYQERYRQPPNGWLKRHVLRHALSAWLAVADVLLRIKERRG